MLQNLTWTCFKNNTPIILIAQETMPILLLGLLILHFQITLKHEPQHQELEETKQGDLAKERERRVRGIVWT